MAQYLGRAFIRANGMTLASLPGTGKLNPGGYERVPIVGDFGFLGFSEKPMHGEVECEIAVGKDTNLDQLNKTTDTTITFEGDTGQVWVMRNAAIATPVGPQAGEGGKASVKFIGAPAEEV